MKELAQKIINRSPNHERKAIKDALSKYPLVLVEGNLGEHLTLIFLESRDSVEYREEWGHYAFTEARSAYYLTCCDRDDEKSFKGYFVETEGLTCPEYTEYRLREILRLPVLSTRHDITYYTDIFGNTFDQGDMASKVESPKISMHLLLTTPTPDEYAQQLHSLYFQGELVGLVECYGSGACEYDLHLVDSLEMTKLTEYVRSRFFTPWGDEDPEVSFDDDCDFIDSTLLNLIDQHREISK